MAAAFHATPPPGYRYLGTLGRTFQLSGGLRLYPAGAQEAEALASVDAVFVEGLGESRVRELRPHGGHLIVYLVRVRTREQAQRLVNAPVYADPASLPTPPEDLPYLDTLIGASVVRVSLEGLEEKWLGEVAEVLSGSGQDLLVVESPRGRVLLPWQAPYVRVDGDRVEVVDPPEGLLED